MIYGRGHEKIIVFVFRQCACACVLAKFIGTAHWAKNISVDLRFQKLTNKDGG